MTIRNPISSSSSSSRRASPDRAAASFDSNDPAASRTPKRVGSFGKGLGAALANSMTRATEGLSGKKSASAFAQSPALVSPNPAAAIEGSKEFPFAHISGTASPGNGLAPPTGLSAAAAAHATPDPSHLQNFGLRLSELVNQALAPTVAMHQSSSGGVSSVAKHAPGRSNIPSIDQIIYEGKKLPSRAKIQELAQTVVAELRYAKSVETYFLRAASRAAFKALTLFASRMDSLLVPVAKDPSSLIMPTSAKEGIHISPALEYNLGVATLTWIVEDALERCIEGDDDDPANYQGMPSFVSEILTPVRKRMETTILHVIQPVLNGVKTSLSASVMKSVRYPFIAGGSPPLTPSISNETPQPPLSPMTSGTSAFNSPKATDSTLVSASASANWLKELQGRLEGSRKLLVPRIEARTSQDGEGWFISVAVHLIWKGLFVLTARPIEGKGTAAGHSKYFLSPGQQQAFADTAKRNPSPVQLTAALRSVASVGSGRATPTSGDVSAVRQETPVGSGVLGGSGSLPSKSAVAAANKASMAQIADIQAFQKMALRFCKGFVSDKALAAVAAELSRADAAEEEVEGDQQLQEEDEEDELARQALAEALEALNSTLTVIQAMEFNFAGLRAALDRGAGHSPCADVRSSQESTGDGGLTSPPAHKPFNQKRPTTQANGVKPLDALQLRALRAIPPLLLMHLAYARLPTAVKLPSSTSNEFLSPPPALFGLSWQEYERSIAGFVGGSSWAQAAVQRWDKEVRELWGNLSDKQAEIVDRRERRLRELTPGSQDGDDEAAGAAEETFDANMTLGIGGAHADVEDLGTTPTQRRPEGGPAGALNIHRQALSRSTSSASRASDVSSVAERSEDEDDSGDPISDASQATPRGPDSNLKTAKSRSSRFGFRLGGGTFSRSQSQSGDGRSQDAPVSSQDSSRRGTPEASPPPPPSPGLYEDAGSSIGALNIGGGSNTTGTSTPAKARFWRSSNNSSGTQQHNGNGSSGNGFRLPSVPRPSFGRTNSPGGARSPGPGASGGIGERSTSGSRLRNSSTSASDIKSSSSTASLSSMGGVAGSQSGAWPVGAVSSSVEEAKQIAEMELQEVERSQDALLFFAKVLEWAAWSGGSEYRCKLDNE